MNMICTKSIFITSGYLVCSSLSLVHCDIFWIGQNYHCVWWSLFIPVLYWRTNYDWHCSVLYFTSSHKGESCGSSNTSPSY